MLAAQHTQQLQAWAQHLHVVREAINALSSGDQRLQRPADAWLQQFSASPGSWRLCLKLLEAPDVKPNECFFAANNIKTACLKHQDVLEVVTLGELLPQLAYHLQACLHKMQWGPANQLAAAIASLAARSGSMQADALPQLICSSFSPTVAQALADASAATTAASTAAEAAAAAAERGAQQQPQTQLPQGQWGYSGWHSNIGSQSDSNAAAAMATAAAAASARSQEHLQMRLQQEPLVLAALLQVLAALPDTLQSRQVLWYSFDRREAVKAGLMASNSTTLVVAAALCSQNSRLLMLSCEVLAAVCELGAPPIGLEVQTGALQVLSGALLAGSTCVKAADALAALANACKGSGTGGNAAADTRWQLLLQVLQQLQYAVFLALRGQHGVLGRPPGPSSSAAPQPALAPGMVSYIQVVGAQFSANAEAAFCKLLCAVASALLTPMLKGAALPDGLMEDLLKQLLLGIAVENDGVAMTAVHFFQEDFVEQMMALDGAQQAAALQQQQPLLQALAEALVHRAQLKPAALASATADARDLPEEMRMIRRELAAALREVASLVGRDVMLSYMVQLVTKHQQALLGDTGGRGEPAAGGGSAGAAGSKAALTPAVCCELEGALYAANVILGRFCDADTPEIDKQVQQLVAFAAAAARQHTDIHKLAGTALTLMGGLAAWLMKHPTYLPQVLDATITALRSPDDKLARNAATCVQRLTSYEQLASLLFAAQPASVQQLLQEYQRRGGLPVTLVPSIGDDQSTEELLLLALCSIAVAHSSSSNSIADINSILSQLVGPQLSEAGQELRAALQGNWPQQLPSVLQAPSPPQPPPQPRPRDHRPRRGTLAQRPQPQPQNSRSAVCFEAVAKLISGLPTGVGKYSIGVPMHTRHPRHQQMLLQVQTLLGLPPVSLPGQQEPAGSDAAAAASSLVAAASTASVAASEAGSAAGPQAPAGPEGAAGPLMALLHVGQGRQQPQYAVARQQHACLFVSQLVVQAQEVMVLALQAITQAAAQQQTARFGSQLLSAVSNFLQSALPAALHYHALATGSSSYSAGPQAEVSGLGSAAGPSELGMTATALQPSVMIMQLCQLLETLPADKLQQTKALQLLLTVVTCAALAGALPPDECLNLEALAFQQQQQQPSQLPLRPQQDRQQQQLLMLLQRLVGVGLTAACQSIVQQQGGADEEFAAAALSLASVSLQLCPAVLVSVDIGLLFSMTLVASRTYHLKQVTALLDWIQVATFGAYAQVQPVWDASGGSTLAPSAAPIGLAAATGVGFSRNLLAALRVRLEAGVGAQLVLALMLAAAGAMPSDVVLPVSLCMHSMWLTVGPQLFQSWLQAAVLQVAPDAAPWARVRHVLKVQFLQNMTERSCLTDTTKYKGILKSFCGGKKKVWG